MVFPGQQNKHHLLHRVKDNRKLWKIRKGSKVGMGGLRDTVGQSSGAKLFANMGENIYYD